MRGLSEIASSVLGEAVDVVEVLTEEERRNTVARVMIITGARAGTSLIVKQTVGFDSPEAATDIRLRLYREAVAATVLTRLAPGEHSPRLHGLDPRNGLMIFDDLGHPDSLVQPLMSDGAAADARTAMINYVRRLGSLHAATAGQLQVWDQVVVELGAPEQLLTQQVLLGDGRTFDRGIAGLDAQLVDLGLPTTAEALDGRLPAELATIRNSVTEPGPFTVLIHQDSCPDNVVSTPAGTRLIDFEFARPGHALIDGLYPQVPFPTCWCCNQLPEELSDELAAIYRAELIVGVPQAADDNAYDDATAQLMAYWLITSFDWIFEDVLTESRTWGIASTRSRELSRLDSFIRCARRTGRLPALLGLAEQLNRTLSDRWSTEGPLPVYPAFRRAGRSVTGSD